MMVDSGTKLMHSQQGRHALLPRPDEILPTIRQNFTGDIPITHPLTCSPLGSYLRGDILRVAREDVDVATVAVLNQQNPIDWLLHVETVLLDLSQFEDIRRHLVKQPFRNWQSC